MNDQQKKCIELGSYFEFMPGAKPGLHQSLLSHLFLKHPIVESVTFFGGSFNPFHQGHRACLDLCPEKNILIVPDRNPFKAGSDRPENVYDLFLDLAQELKDTPYSLYPGFLGLDRPNPTASWLPNVMIKEKNFLMGDDSYMSLLKWKDPKALLMALTKLYIVPRSYERHDYLRQEREVLGMNPDLVIHYLADHPYKNISSTEIRR